MPSVIRVITSLFSIDPFPHCCVLFSFSHPWTVSLKYFLSSSPLSLPLTTGVNHYTLLLLNPVTTGKWFLCVRVKARVRSHSKKIRCILVLASAAHFENNFSSFIFYGINLLFLFLVHNVTTTLLSILIHFILRIIAEWYFENGVQSLACLGSTSKIFSIKLKFCSFHSLKILKEENKS